MRAHLSRRFISDAPLFGRDREIIAFDLDRGSAMPDQSEERLVFRRDQLQRAVSPCHLAFINGGCGGL
jgi:hypothetical protein